MADLAGGYLVAIGGDETFARPLDQPWPALLQAGLGRPVVNLGHPHAGPDLFLGDAGLRQLIAGASGGVVQVMGAVNLSNGFYAVHPRRNDRFLSATPALRQLYPDVDFTEIHFTRHLIHTLWRRDTRRFARIAAELRQVWHMRMVALLRLIPAPRLLLWLAEQPVPAAAPFPFGTPALVDRLLLQSLSPWVMARVEQAGAAPPDLGAAHRAAAARLGDLLAPTLPAPALPAPTGMQNGAPGEGRPV